MTRVFEDLLILACQKFGICFITKIAIFINMHIFLPKYAVKCIEVTRIIFTSALPPLVYESSDESLCDDSMWMLMLL